MPEAQQPCVATIGNFDGVHLGHEMVISTLLSAGRQLELPSTVVTFDPLAKEYFAPQAAQRLQPLSQRIERLAELGVGQVLVIDFDKDLAAYSPAKFVDEILIAGLGIKYLSVGDDFRFGKDRAGDFNFLQGAATKHGFELIAHDTFTLDGGRVSSGRVRDAVSVGNFDAAQALLGRRYTIAGVVQHGEQRGRTINFPTANLVLDAENYAVHGVYAVAVQLPNGVVGGVANVGKRPTVEGQENRLEVHLFDFDDDIYDQPITVNFLQKIRPEQKFESFTALREQIELDVAAAREVCTASEFIHS